MVASSWTSTETRDGNHGSFSRHLTICRTARWSSPPPPPPPPAAARRPARQPTLSTTASPGVALGGAIHDTALLSGGSSPTGTITFSALPASDTTCSTVLDTGSVGGQRRRQLRLAGGHARERGRLPVGRDLQRRRQQQRAPRPRATTPTSRRPSPRSWSWRSCVPSPVVLRGLAAKVRRVAVGSRDGAGRQERDLLPRRSQAQDGDQVQEPALLDQGQRAGLGYGRHRLQAKVTDAQRDVRHRRGPSSVRQGQADHRPTAPVHRLAATKFVPGVGIRAARSLALGIGIGALAFGPGAGAAGAATPRRRGRQAVPGEVVLSNGRTLSRWAYPQTAAIVARPHRARPTRWGGCTS